ncbi:hypothetical protein [Deinococcus puniceus]|uniref:hypothetical protein n=1 Tax=Deinococcus puniceus TaxID=1182568 RepID=UPI0012F927D7|nr:hypothetical protein [Deinococcus puniceus]
MIPDPENISIAVTKDSWRRRFELPKKRSVLDFSRTYTADEFRLIIQGFKPREMEDKWFIYFESPYLYVHRSWTGYCIFLTEFRKSNDGIQIVEALVNADKKQYDSSDLNYSQELLDFLISRILLKKSVSFPTPQDVPLEERAIYQHSVSGTGITEEIIANDDES